MIIVETKNNKRIKHRIIKQAKYNYTNNNNTDLEEDEDGKRTITTSKMWSFLKFINCLFFFKFIFLQLKKEKQSQ